MPDLGGVWCSHGTLETKSHFPFPPRSLTFPCIFSKILNYSSIKFPICKTEMIIITYPTWLLDFRKDFQNFS